MSLLDNLPHRCTIRRRVRTKGTLGGSKDSYTNEQTNVRCWEQAAGDAESLEYQKRGMTITHKVYFASAPSVTENHQILVTQRNGVAISSPTVLEVRSQPQPDASAGMGVTWKVMAEETTGDED